MDSSGPNITKAVFSLLSATNNSNTSNNTGDFTVQELSQLNHNFIWNGGSGGWSVGGNGWTNGNWIDGMGAVFGRGIDATGTVTIPSKITPGSITFNPRLIQEHIQLRPGQSTQTMGELDITANADATIASTLTNGTLFKLGTGTLTLSGTTNTYTGITFVGAGGTLVHNSNLTGVGGVVEVYGTLRGQGTISDRPVYSNAGGSVTARDLTTSGSAVTPNEALTVDSLDMGSRWGS